MERRLPCKTMTSLGEVATILKKYFDRDNIDEYYLIDLAHQGYIKLYAKISLDRSYYACPMILDDKEYEVDSIKLDLNNESIEFKSRNKVKEIQLFDRLQQICVGLADYESCTHIYGEIGQFYIYDILISDTEDDTEVNIIDIYDAKFDQFLEISKVFGKVEIYLYEIEEGLKLNSVFSNAIATEHFSIQHLEADEIENWKYLEIDKLKEILKIENKEIDKIIELSKVKLGCYGRTYLWYSDYGDKRTPKKIHANLKNLHIHKSCFEKILQGCLEIDPLVLKERKRFKVNNEERELIVNNKLKKPRGKSQKKENAQLAARTLASYLWNQDKAKKIKITQMAITIKAELNFTEHAEQLPDQSTSLKDWIKDVAPEYAREPGRMKENG